MQSAVRLIDEFIFVPSIYSDTRHYLIAGMCMWVTLGSGQFILLSYIVHQLNPSFTVRRDDSCYPYIRFPGKEIMARNSTRRHDTHRSWISSLRLHCGRIPDRYPGRR